MELIYLLIGETSFLLNNKINEIKDLNLIDDFNLLRFDSNEEEIDDILQELNTVSFFSDKKLVIIRNANSLKRFKKEDLLELEKYLKNPNPDVIVIFTNSNDIEDKQIQKLLDKYCYKEKLLSIKREELPKYILNRFSVDNYIIDNDAINALIERTEINQDLLEVEITKLKTYKLKEKIINEDDVINLVPRTLEDNIFHFSQMFLRNEVNKYMLIYQDLISSKITPLTILNHLFNNINLILQVKILLNERYTQNMISERLLISSGRTYYLMKDAKTQSIKFLENIIKELATLDLNIKLGLQDERVGLELLLLGKKNEVRL
ncbi:MAG: DNA polymerase III subunit delta [Acholeplasmataceae bacterium]